MVPNYRVVAVSLYSDEAAAIDRIARALQEAGFPKASRSFVVQAAIRRLEEELQGKCGPDLARYFLDRLRRPLARAGPRQRVTQSRRGVSGSDPTASG
jgi:hypothetical protein